MAAGDPRDGLTSPRAVLAYGLVVGTVLLFQHFGWHPTSLVGALLLLPWLSQHGAHEDADRRPPWWAAHGSVALFFVSLAVAVVTAEGLAGPWSTPALVLAVPFTPVVLPACSLLGTPALGGSIPHLPASVVILTPIYGFALHRWQLRRFEDRQQRMRVARRRINAALKSGTAEIEKQRSDTVVPAATA